MTEAARQPPDYKIGNFMLLLSEFCDFCRLVGVDGGTFGSLSAIAHEAYRAICIRGARAGELVAAVEGLRSGAGRPERMAIADSKVASIAMWLAARAKSARRLGVGVELFGRLQELAEALYHALTHRGASAAHVVAVLRTVREHGSIGRDLPSLQREDDPETE